MLRAGALELVDGSRTVTARQTAKALRALASAHAHLEPARRRAIGGLLENTADPRELAVLVMRFGLDGPPKSLGRVAETLGVSRARVSQIEQRAMERLEASKKPERAPSTDAMRKRKRASAIKRRVERTTSMRGGERVPRRRTGRITGTP
jgi:hypothetical protein